MKGAQRLAEMGSRKGAQGGKGANRACRHGDQVQLNGVCSIRRDSGRQAARLDGPGRRDKRGACSELKIARHRYSRSAQDRGVEEDRRRSAVSDCSACLRAHAHVGRVADAVPITYAGSDEDPGSRRLLPGNSSPRQAPSRHLNSLHGVMFAKSCT